MFGRQPSRKSSGIGQREYEVLLRQGITAAKNGERKRAKRLLNRATMTNRSDARPWIWLAATTDDIDEQRNYLEKAVGLEPSNATARRALIQLERNPNALAPSPHDPDVSEHLVAAKPTKSHDHAALGESVTCPKCSGRMNFDITNGQLTCEFCGHMERVNSRMDADRAEQSIDQVLLDTSGHTWAEGRSQFACENCGAVSWLENQKRATQCPYCGSNHIVQSDSLRGLIQPQVIALFRMREQAALQKAKDWLNTGLFAPDDLQKSARTLALRPAYYPFWTFDGTLEVPWSCEVASSIAGSSQNKQWRPANGVGHKFFDDVLIAGSGAVSRKEVESISPFELKAVVDFKPEHLAGWDTLAYDRSMSDASLLAREEVIRKFRRELYPQIEPGKEKRNVQFGGGNWSGMSFKHLLLPIWVGTYYYNKEEFHVMVNGQTGKVGGSKPKDNFKVIGIWLIGIVIALLLAVIVWMLLPSFIAGG